MDSAPFLGYSSFLPMVGCGIVGTWGKVEMKTESFEKPWSCCSVGYASGKSYSLVEIGRRGTDDVVVVVVGDSVEIGDGGSESFGTLTWIVYWARGAPYFGQTR